MALGFRPGNRPAIEESVDDRPDMEQTGQRDESGCLLNVCCGKGTDSVIRLPICPFCGDQ
jgi:hypothetical protein